tara:strand:+ start:1937 stop:2977 length:1041 start_codon:yes stop_codon:yes gene_type:complete
MKTPKDIGLSHSDRLFFVAEAGINHNGSLENAIKLVNIAKRAGADAVKFQKRTINKILTKDGLNKLYENANSFGKTYGEHKENLELSKKDFKELKQYADKIGIPLIASAWDEESVDFLYEIGVSFYKVASADLTNFPLLEYTAKKQLPIIISTGMADFETVQEAYELVSMINDRIAILQCTSSYPTNHKDINLNVIKTYQEHFKSAVVGYSGHEQGISISIAAAALGAKIIERHFTIDKNMKGGDHKASLNEEELTTLIKEIRIVETAMGNFCKKKLESEQKCFIKLSKSLVTTQKIKKGEKIKREHLTTKGPGDGISPMKMYLIIGRVVNRDIDEDTVLYNDYLL